MEKIFLEAFLFSTTAPYSSNTASEMYGTCDQPAHYHNLGPYLRFTSNDGFMHELNKLQLRVSLRGAQKSRIYFDFNYINLNALTAPKELHSLKRIGVSYS